MAKYLDDSGVSYLWQKIKDTFAAINHNHDASYIHAGSSTTSGHVVTWGNDGVTVADSGKTTSDFADASHTHSQYQPKLYVAHPLKFADSQNSRLVLTTTTPTITHTLMKGGSVIFPDNYRVVSFNPTSYYGTCVVTLSQLKMDDYDEFTGTTVKTFIFHDNTGTGQSTQVDFVQTGEDYDEYVNNPSILNMSGVSLPVTVPGYGYLVMEACYCPEYLSESYKGINPNQSRWIITRIVSGD